jgi:hypothetical protein
VKRPNLLLVLLLLVFVHAALAAEAPKPSAYMPTPKPVKTHILVGAHNCPLWEASSPHMWDQGNFDGNFDSITLCLVTAITKPTSPAQRSVRAGAQKQSLFNLVTDEPLHESL